MNPFPRILKSENKFYLVERGRYGGDPYALTLVKSKSEFIKLCKELGFTIIKEEINYAECESSNEWIRMNRTIDIWQPLENKNV